MRAVIVGGGIAGPATAMALQMVGIESVILEARRDDARDSGSWLTVAPNGIAALDVIGALDAVRSIGVPTRHNVMVGATGRELGVISLGDPLPDGTPALSFARPALARALVDEAVRRGIDHRGGHRVVDVADIGDRAQVTLDDGSVETGDVVIGADGIHSVVRARIDPNTPRGRYVGLVNFGGISRDCEEASRLRPAAWRFVFGRRAFFGALPTPDGDVVWFVNVPRDQVTASERSGITEEGWRAVLADLASADEGPFAELIAHGRLELIGDNTHDLPSVPVWHRGRLGLVGDAVHAPAPSSGQGASMALEDAVVMASSLAGGGAIEDCLADFEEARRARVEKIVAVGARSSSTKTRQGLWRIVNDAMLRLVFRYVVTDESQRWIVDHRVALTDGGPAFR